MAITATTPVSPWTTGIGGAGTWDDVVAFVNNTAIISKVGSSTYVVTGLLDITAVLSPLLNCIVIAKGGGNWSIGSGGVVTFGQSVINNSGQTVYTDGCTLIEDTDAYPRGIDPYNGTTKCMVRTGGTMNLYASTILSRNSQQSFFDTQQGSTFKVRNSRHHQQAAVNCFDHYAGVIDWDGYVSTHASDTSGALLELMSTSTIVKLKGFTPYLNSASTRQCTLWIGSVTLANYGGDNFASWNGTGYYRMTDPLTTGLIRVDQAGSGGLSACEMRTASLLCLSGISPVQAQVIAVNNTGMVDFNTTASTLGIATGLLKRTVFAGGSSWPVSGIARTPHVVYAKKWGYKTYSTLLSAAPTSYAQAQIQAIMPMVADSNITLSSSAAAAISGVSIAWHGRPVSWNGKNYSMTITANSSLTPSQVYHSVAYQASELTTFQPRVSAYFNNAGGQKYFMTWPGASGNTDLTLVVVHRSRDANQIFGNQIPASIGDGSNGIALRTCIYNGMVMQNYITDIWPDTSYTANQLQHVNPDGGDQLMITIGVYTASAGKMTLYSNNYTYGQATCTITRTGTSYFAVGSWSNSGSWAVQYHHLHEQMGFDRALSAAEVSKLFYYLGKKWNYTGFGNIVPSVTPAYTPASYPVNGSGADWTPADFATGQGPRCWVDMSSPANYVLSGSNIASFKDLVSGNQITNSGYSSAQVATEGAGFVLPQLMSDPANTIGATYADGIFRGVRIVDQNGNAFPGMNSFQSDDGTIYTPPVTLTISANVSLVGAEIRVYDLSGASDNYGLDVAGIESCAGPTFSFSGTSGANIMIQIMLAGYVEYTQSATIPASSSTFTATLLIDNNS